MLLVDAAGRWREEQGIGRVGLRPVDAGATEIDPSGRGDVGERPSIRAVGERDHAIGPGSTDQLPARR